MSSKLNFENTRGRAVLKWSERWSGPRVSDDLQAYMSVYTTFTNVVATSVRLHRSLRRAPVSVFQSGWHNSLVQSLRLDITSSAYVVTKSSVEELHLPCPCHQQQQLQSALNRTSISKTSAHHSPSSRIYWLVLVHVNRSNLLMRNRTRRQASKTRFRYLDALPCSALSARDRIVNPKRPS